MIKLQLQRFLNWLLPHLDAAIDAGVEHRGVVLKLGVPSTFLFALLLGWFTGSGGVLVKSLLALAALEGGVVGGVIWLRARYGDDLARTRKREAANAIDGFVCDEDYFSNWETFLKQPSGDPEIEQIRLHCQQIPREYPPPHPGEYCGLLGIEVLRAYVRQLRAGLATMLVEDLYRRRATAQPEKAGEMEPDPSETHDPLAMSSMIDHEPRPNMRRVQPKARHDPPAGPAAVSPDATRDTPDRPILEPDATRDTPDRPILEPDATRDKPDRPSPEPGPTGPEPGRGGAGRDRTSAGPSLDVGSPFVPLDLDDALEQSALGATRQPRRVQPRKRPDRPAARRQAPVEAPGPTPPQVKPPLPEPAAEAPPPPPAVVEPPPPAPAEIEPAAAPGGRLTEAGAIQQILKAGFTAHDYDYQQFSLSEALGRPASPDEVVHAMLAQRQQIDDRKASGGALTEAGAIQELMESGFTAHDYDRKLHELFDQHGHEVTPAEVVADLLEEGRQPPEPPKPPTRQPSPEREPQEATRPKGLTEAGAIQELMKEGFSAHDYDSKSYELAARRGRPVSPAQVMRALRSDAKKPAQKKGRKAGKKQKQKRENRPDITAWAQATAPSRPRRRLPVPILALGLPLLPFAAWRIPLGDAVTIQGELRYRIYEPAPNVAQFLRTPFESMFGNQGISLVDGPHLYLTEDDYKRCWPPDLYTAGYRLYVTAEARPLLFGGYGVAKVQSIERINQSVRITD